MQYKIETVTTTPTSTLQLCTTAVPSLADNSCANAGMQWAYYSDPTLAALIDPGVLRTTAPAADGVADSYGATAVAGWGDNCDNLPGYMAGFYNTVQYCVYFAFAFRGYVYAGISGDYVFTITTADDIVNVWIGNDDVVRDGYDVDNISISNRGGSLTFTYTAVAGTYIPLRVVLNQITGPWSEGLSIQAPDGGFILSTAGTTQNLVQFGCGGSTPAWLPWGSEVSL